MAFTLPEALWLAAEGLSDDILVAYPTADRAALGRARPPTSTPPPAITVMVDCAEHLDLIESGRRRPARSASASTSTPRWRAAGGRVRIGALPLPDPHPRAGRRVRPGDRPRGPALRLVGLMAYESQIAGVGDAPPGKPLLAARDPLHAGAVARRAGPPPRRDRPGRPARWPTWSSSTAAAPAASRRPRPRRRSPRSPPDPGLYQSRLFDHYTNFSGRPAALFALPVVRRPGPAWSPSSAAATSPPVVADAEPPAPAVPADGPALRPQRGRRRGADAAARRAPPTGCEIGDRVWFRHAKAGELCERFDELHLIDGDRVAGPCRPTGARARPSSDRGAGGARGAAAPAFSAAAGHRARSA